MHYQELARTLLFGPTLDDKLIAINNISFEPNTSVLELPKEPGRTEMLKFKDEQIPFPKRSSFHLDDKRALALHFFANHELMAIEMMAAALLIYPDSSPEMSLFKKGLIKTIADEQKHLSMYLNRMDQFGLRLGDFPLNDFFWRAMEKLKTPSQFYAVIALTFESANLDFAQSYEKAFLEVGDTESASIMKVICEDEITHVALGAHWLNRWKGDRDLWNYFNENLPPLLTPARAKGIHFDPDLRKKAGLDEDFIKKLEDYRDPFKITNRKTW